MKMRESKLIILLSGHIPQLLVATCIHSSYTCTTYDYVNCCLGAYIQVIMCSQTIRAADKTRLMLLSFPRVGIVSVMQMKIAGMEQTQTVAK